MILPQAAASTAATAAQPIVHTSPSPSALAAAIDAVAALITSRACTKRALFSVMESLHGASSASGAWSQRDAFDLLETGLTKVLKAHFAQPSQADLETLSALIDTLPTHTVRSEAQIRYQQFSTPADIAALAVLHAQVREDDVVLEPSAGHGALAAMLGPVASLTLNEISEPRRAALSVLFPEAQITAHDGALIDGLAHELMAPGLRPSLILMNPPFARSLGRSRDAHAAVRHLRAALRLLQPGGRLVAIMPRWFEPSSRLGAIYDRTLEGCSLVVNDIITDGYRKHGTSVAVRLVVIDKTPGQVRCQGVEARNVADWIEQYQAQGRRFTALRPEAAFAMSVVTPITGKARPLTAPAKPATLFSSIRASSAAKGAGRTLPKRKAASASAATRHEDTPLAYRPLAAPRPLGEPHGLYLPYRPSRVECMAARPHPSPLVESIAMGSIPAPVPGYAPRFPARLAANGTLSEAQLETVIYAGHAWSQVLPGKFRPSEENLDLILDEEKGRAYRRGYFLGDGTGAGKGRQIAGCILDAWLGGARKAIWISKNESLLEDARRDWCALGGVASDIQPLSSVAIDQPIGFREGIIFVTYPTLRSQRHEATRLQQLLNWAGAGFDGVIAFDEAHEMGGVAGGEGARGKKAASQQGIAGVMLQNALPEARVLYASATGASDVSNLAYAVRLGLWGPGTAFGSRDGFISEIRAGGVAAMELVARDLKAQGLYQARALSFAGVEYDILRHDLSPEQIAVYDTYCDAWAIIHSNLEAALALTGIVDDLDGSTLNSAAKSAARSRFESVKQRFFNQLLLSMKLPSVITAIKHHLAQGQSVAIQLVSTGESILNRRLDDLSAEDRADLDLDLSPRDGVIDYLTRAFPTQQMQVFTDDTGTARSMPMVDQHGNPVHNQQALAERDKLIEHLCAMPPIKPVLDGLIEHFGTDIISEVTGRTRRLIQATDGSQHIETRSARSNASEAAAFMAGDKRVLVFSDAGGTGRSYHASLDARNQQQRVHFLLEPGWRADRAIQGLGRTHRTHQASTPLFRPVTTNCKGELRFTSTIARRLDSLGALTRGQRQTGGQNLFDPADNLESPYAKSALTSWYHLLTEGRLESTTMAGFTSRTGLTLVSEEGVLLDDLPPIQRWLNRILALPIAMQNAIFDEFLALVETRVQAAREAGTLDLGVETIAAEHVHVLDDTVLRTDPQSKATSNLLTLELETRLRPISLARIRELKERAGGATLLRNSQSGKAALSVPSRHAMADDGSLIRRVVLHRPLRREYQLHEALAESAWAPCDTKTFDAAWQAEVEASEGTLARSSIHLATGLLLPIWSAFAKDHLEVRRILAADGTSWLGRVVRDTDVSAMLRAFGIERESSVSTAGIVQALSEGRAARIEQPFAASFKRSRVAGEWRYEIVGAPADQLDWLKSLGCFTEIIAYRTRVFVPVDRAEQVVSSIMNRHD